MTSFRREYGALKTTADSLFTFYKTSTDRRGIHVTDQWVNRLFSLPRSFS